MMEPPHGAGIPANGSAPARRPRGNAGVTVRDGMRRPPRTQMRAGSRSTGDA